jgi:hypothetical protein
MKSAVPSSRRILAAACIALLAMRSATVFCVHEDGGPRAESLLFASCCGTADSGHSACDPAPGAAWGGHDRDHGDGPCRNCSDYSCGTITPQCACDGGPSLDEVSLAASFVPAALESAVLRFPEEFSFRYAAGPPPPPILPRLRSVFLTL